MMSSLLYRAAGACALALFAASSFGCGSARPDALAAQGANPPTDYLAARKAEATALPTAPTGLPKGTTTATELQYMIQLGEQLMRETNAHALTAPYVPASGLTCSSCHVDAGKAKKLASTFVGVAASFPAFNPRDKSVITLQDRINSCFMRSMNGMRLPAGSQALLAMEAYITWLSQGTPIRMNPDRAVAGVNASFPNPAIVAIDKAGHASPANGAAVYAARCVMCHGADGNGVGTNPPVWGPRSYNAGAGNAGVGEGGTWVQFNMPPGEEFTLLDQDAADVMAYVNGQPRPPFVEADHLPNAGTTLASGPEAVYHYGRYFTTTDWSTRVPSP